MVHASPAEPVTQTDWEAQELRTSIIQNLAIALTLGAGIAWTTVGAVGRFDRHRFNVFLALFCFGVLVYVFNRYYRWVARVILVLGPTTCLIMALITIPHTLVPAFAALIVIINAIASPWMGIASAILCSLSLWAYGSSETLLASLALVWASAALQTIITQGLYTAVKWSTASQNRVLDLLTETRERRGELRRTLDSLTEATRRLERTRYELAVARRQAEESSHIKAQFAANISHELRTPLNLMIGFSEMMFRTPEVYGDVSWTPALRADIREIYNSSRHLMGMVDDILDLARVEVDRLPLRLEQLNLRDLVVEATDTIASLIRNSPVNLVVDVPSDLPLIMVDRARIRQVLINLLNNAGRFTDQGSITVSARELSACLVVSVRDTGVGIPDDQLDVIFEEFGQATGPITSGRGGIGLGLAICQQFVRLHGGDITATSELGVGSTFSFTLPLQADAVTERPVAFYAPEEWSPIIPENPMGKTAILVAPEHGDIDVARQIEGYRTLPIVGLDRLEALVKSEHPSGIVLLSEPFLPVTFGPEDVWRAAGRRDLPVVTCQVPMSDVTRAALGICATLQKPVQIDQVAKIVERHALGTSRFLIVDDDAGFAALMARMLASLFPEAVIQRAFGGAEATAMLVSTRFDAIFLDLILDQDTGMEFLSRWRQEELVQGAAIVLTTGVSYAEDAALLCPTKVELAQASSHSPVGRYVAALLDVAPPSYATPIVAER